MKKNIFYLAIILIIISCETALDVEIQDSFNFEITTNQNEISLISNKIETKLIITPEREVTGTDYYFSYTLENGTGYYTLNNEILSPNQEYKLSSLTTDLFYTGEDLGTHKTNIQIRNDNELKVEHLVSYKIIDQTDFQFTITKSANEVFITEDIILNFDIQKLSNELLQNLTYNLKYVSSSLNGALKIGANEITPGQIISNLSDGNFEGIFTASVPGDFELIFLAEASNGKQQEVIVNFKVKQTDFNFTVEPSEYSDYVNDITAFRFEIEKTGVENLTYKLSFTGQDGEFRKGVNTYNNGDLFNIPQGVFIMDYKALEITNNPITIEIKASNGVIKTKTVSYESLATDFEVIFSPDTFSQFYAFSVSANFSIIPPPVDNYFLTYKFYYTTTGLGSTKLEELNTNSNVLPGEIIDLGANRTARINLSQLGTTSIRNGKITFIIIDSNGVQIEKVIDVDWHL